MDTRRRAEEVFEAALELEPAERSQYVARVCAYDAGLLRQVVALLGAHDRTDGVLEQDARALLRPEPMPERLGAYRLMRELGRGGMGVVYEAERDDGQFRRRVAIKVLRAGTEPVLRQRVVAERQILAGLDHPDIARLLDGGVTPDGRPYLVMEHVDGLPVDVYCDRMRLSVAERLHLFIIIARAVDYAHRNLVVHRDLKPSNIMVTTDGGVKLLDFGVAKLLNPALGGPTPHTLHDRLALTPEYASPEQLRGESLTTLSDVYALGVLLYELLTGRRPFAAAGLAPLLRAVSDDEPVPPSARVARSETAPALDGGSRTCDPAAVARARHTTPARLARTLAGDLDAIVSTALRKEPRHRYGSAELLAQDVERYLEGRPVLAQRRGRAYAFGKFVRRHRVPALAIALAVVSLLGGTAAALWQAAVAREQRDRAAEAHSQAEQVTEFVLDLFETDALQPWVRGVVTARDLVQRGTERIDDLAGQPLVQASLLGALGRAYDGLGEYEEGQRLTQRALTIHLTQPRRDELATAEMWLQLGVLQRRRSEYDSAQASFFAARAAVEGGPPAPRLLGDILHQLASIAIYRGDLLEAERRITDALEQMRRELGETHAVTVNTLAQLASVQWRRGRLEAEATFRRVIELRPRVPGFSRADLQNDRMGLANMLLTERLRLDEAEATFRSVIAATPAGQPASITLGVWARENLSIVLEERGEFAEAERLRHEELRMRRAVHGDDHPSTGGSLTALARFMTRRGRFAEAQQLLDEAGATIRRTVGERNAIFASWLFDLGALHLARGDLHSADSLMARGLDLRAQLTARKGGPFAVSLRDHAEVKIRLGQYELAETMLNEAMDIARAQTVERGREARRIHAGFAQLYEARGRPADARRHRELAQPMPIVQ
jgi:serine/threonine-protein kinase